MVRSVGPASSPSPHFDPLQELSASLRRSIEEFQNSIQELLQLPGKADNASYLKQVAMQIQKLHPLSKEAAELKG